MVKYIGDIADVINEYQRITYDQTSNDLLSRTDRQGTGAVKLQTIEILDPNCLPIDSVMVGSTFKIRVTLKNYFWSISDEILELYVGVNDEYGQRNFIMNNIFLDKNIKILSGDTTQFTFTIESCPLNIGNYSLAFYLSNKSGDVVEAINNVGCLHVESGDFYGTGKCNRYGLGRFIVKYDLQ